MFRFRLICLQEAFSVSKNQGHLRIVIYVRNACVAGLLVGGMVSSKLRHIGAASVCYIS